MKNLLYTLILLLTISGELVNLVIVLSLELDTIEVVNEIKGENESEENKDLGEDASEIPTSQFDLIQAYPGQVKMAFNSLVFNDDKFCRVATPPPDYYS